MHAVGTSEGWDSGPRRPVSVSRCVSALLSQHLLSGILLASSHFAFSFIQGLVSGLLLLLLEPSVQPFCPAPLLIQPLKHCILRKF